MNRAGLRTVLALALLAGVTPAAPVSSAFDFTDTSWTFTALPMQIVFKSKPTGKVLADLQVETQLGLGAGTWTIPGDPVTTGTWKVKGPFDHSFKLPIDETSLETIQVQLASLGTSLAEGVVPGATVTFDTIKIVRSRLIVVPHPLEDTVRARLRIRLRLTGMVDDGVVAKKCSFRMTLDGWSDDQPLESVIP